jgi:uncharacterized protein with ParB-like and HNH nuclease domain
MKADFVNIHNLFGNNVQYRIPLFQRKYVWNNNQWIHLWSDIRDKAVRNEGRMGDDRKKHFTGAIVISSLTAGPEEVPKFEIIDGQQRLTTFQIILCALRDICMPDFSDLSKAADRYIQNKDLVENQPTTLFLPGGMTDQQNRSNEKYKLIPTEADKETLKSVVDGTSNPSNLAYIFFKGEIMEFVSGNNINRHRKILALYQSILNDFDVVQIQIDPNEESEKIFESLNARGRKLGELDHLRNNLFLRSAREVPIQERNDLYKDYWRSFETEKYPGTNKYYWEAEVLEDGERITLFELFFRHFLMAKLGIERIQPTSFDVYQRLYLPTLSEDTQLETEFSEIAKYAKLYQEVVDFKENSYISHRMEFYREFGITSLRPFILFVINELESFTNEEELTDFFDILESYTIRILLCSGKDGIKICDRVFLRLHNYFSRYFHFSGMHKFSLEDLMRWLSNQESNSQNWPTDGEIRLALNGGWAENDGEPKIIRYVLYHIELMKQQENNLTEEVKLSFNQFTLEHIMPESWTEKWYLPVDDTFISYENLFSDKYKEENIDWEANPSKDGLADDHYSKAFDRALNRDKMIQSIGNLTIITGTHNSRLSNRIYEKKRKSFDRNSQLMLNNEIAHRWSSWDIDQIQEREDELYGDFLKKWKYADNTDPLLMSDKIIQLETYQPTLITYDGQLNLLRVSEILPYELKGIIANDTAETSIKKHSILFACSLLAWSELVPRQVLIDGYSRFSFIRASSVVNRQLILVCCSFLRVCHARISCLRVSWSAIRLQRHPRDSTESSISAIFNQLPCLGV